MSRNKLFLLLLAAGLSSTLYSVFILSVCDRPVSCPHTQSCTRHNEDDDERDRLILDLQYQVAMLKARSSPRIHGPLKLHHLSDQDKEEFAKFHMTLQWGEDQNYTDGGSSMGQIPRFLRLQKLMRRTPDGNGWVKEWTETMVEARFRYDMHVSPVNYRGAALQITAALQDFVVMEQGKPPEKMLVAGSISPWVEVIALAVTGVSKIDVTDYQPIVIHDKRLEYIPMTDLVTKRPPQPYDVIISYSSIEHDGLGRYGDPINPGGDLAAMAEFWTLLRPGGLLLLGVPVAKGGLIESNGHRLYSRERIAALANGYQLLKEIPVSKELVQRFHFNQTWRPQPDSWEDQPVFVLRKNPNELPLALQ